MSSEKKEKSLPAISADVSDADKQLNLKEKLALIDNEVRELYEFCVQAGYSPAQIEKCAEPLLVVHSNQTKKKWSKRVAFLLLLVAFIASIYLYQPAYDKFCVYGKLTSMKILPYWDWRYLYEEDCLVNNPYRKEDTVSLDDCQSKCKDLREVDSLIDVNHKLISEFLFNETPVVIKDATEDWKAREQFSVEFLAELFNTSPTLKDSQVCQFQSTKPGYAHPEDFLVDVVNGKVKGTFQTYWENCDRESAKVFRKFYRRPYFLPPMVEAAEGNWMIVSSGGTKSLKVSWSSNVTWLSQITGKSRVILRPDPACDKICKPLTVMLEPGDSILFSNELWSISYKPLGNKPVIAIGATGTMF